MNTLLLPSQEEIETPLNNRLALHIVKEAIQKGVKEFCLSPAARNAPLVYALASLSQIKIYYWPEERSAAFFALGRIKATGRPVAVVTTSGTAAGELLPAAMEAYYTGLPLLLITADRPRRYRGSGAPQSAEQVGLYTYYAHYMQDLEGNDLCQLDKWSCEGPAHLNVCFEEPKDSDCQKIQADNNFPRTTFSSPVKTEDRRHWNAFEEFLAKVHCPLVVVGALHPSQIERTVSFLLALQAPVYAEGISGLREDPRLAHLRVTVIDRIWSLAETHGYPIDGILRIGGVPTARLWRDLEDKAGAIHVCSVSELPFSGLSWAETLYTPLNPFFEWAIQRIKKPEGDYLPWLQADRAAQQFLQQLFHEEPLAEQSLIHGLSTLIPVGSKVYLGNSLPIREWDQAAIWEPKQYKMAANRGVNGIDGQLATFLGYSTSEQDNWAIIGDLTALYDMAAPWISSQMPDVCANVVVINNGGGQIFARMFAHEAFRNSHQLEFKPLADFWKWRYEKWTRIPNQPSPSKGGRLIELLPDQAATDRFFKKMKSLW
ncbi:2-succinyl-5-enolpyruvyl-6-hydroxy-3-cyclohexene-1-carboxylic-acid synthase [Candidatus Protochlamydia phocaeensis]|uniref:2-succinyl-5-enolpyruvyl-6-hydroxy-3- cyclohexene-1-carboxylic-acid synthase n=1 Tax=Candidatus Protochlamydia phocaeensis TaxID=1414722 RepID=UPI000838EA8F|nr:2-succinyl-5-enolpyruvyl-6-hydroxy-3-cyclohexene-1-carboxylic-acid synthase [Candidatus Protochlamydia phocaeensis]